MCENISLTYCHPIERTDHQAVVDLASDPLCEPLVFLCVLGDVDQQLSKGVAANGEGVDEQLARHKAFTLEQFQQAFAAIQTPLWPQEFFCLV